jgi:hypothetical protein
MIKYLILIFSLIVSTSAFSQDDDPYVYGDNTPKPKPTNKKKGFDWSNTTIGGGFGLVLGDVTIVEVAPTLGYYLTDNFLVGIGANYAYEENRTYYNYIANTYGGKIFAQYLLENAPLLAHAEIESANIGINYLDSYYEDLQFNLINVYVGGGLKQRMGGNSFVYVLVLYNLNETKESNYFQQNPIIRIGFAIGL